MLNAPDRRTSEEFLQTAIQEYAFSALKFSVWLEENLSEGFSFFDCPIKHRKTIWTTISLKWINMEILRRTTVVGVFPYEASSL